MRQKRFLLPAALATIIGLLSLWYVPETVGAEADRKTAKPVLRDKARPKPTVPQRTARVPRRAPVAQFASNRFELSISGLQVASNQVRRVRIGDAVTRMMSTGVYNGQENVAPFGVRYGNIQITFATPDLPRSWLTDRQKRDVTIIITHPNNQTLTYNLTGVQPMRMRSDTTLEASVTSVDVSGSSLGVADQGPYVWEWEGVLLRGQVNWQEKPVKPRSLNNGERVFEDASAADASLWQFSATSAGVSTEPLLVLRNYRRGMMDRRSQSRITRDAAGTETERHNYFETLVTRYVFPVLDKDNVVPMQDRVDQIATMVQRDSDNAYVLRGPPNTVLDPLVTSNFLVEISGINLPQSEIVAARLGPATAQLVATVKTLGKENYTPVDVRYGDMQLVTRAGNQMTRAWLADNSGNARDISVVVLGTDNNERTRFNFYGAVPVSISEAQDGYETLTIRGIKTELAGPSAGIPETNSYPRDWEWDGIVTYSPLLAWQEQPVLLSTSPDGSLSRVNSDAANGNFVEFAARTIGINHQYHGMLSNYEDGHIEFKSQSRIERDSNMDETSRRNLFETYVARFEYPYFDKRRHDLVSEKITMMTPLVEAGSGGRLFSGAYNTVRDPLVTRNFFLEIDGLSFEQSAIRSVEIGDEITDIAYAGTYEGKESYVPSNVRFQDVTIRSTGAPALANWYNARKTDPPRTMSLVVLGIDERERARFNIFDTVPKSFTPAGPNDPLDTLVVSVRLLESDGTAGIPEYDPHPEWEWDGVQVAGPIQDWQDRPLNVTRTGIQPTGALQANLWEFTTHTPGLQEVYSQVMRNYREGQYDLRSHSRIIRNAQGDEVDRINFYDAWVSRVDHPRFDRDELKLVSQRVSQLTSLVQKADGGGDPIMRGVPALNQDPLLSNRFRVEIEGMHLSNEHVQAVIFDDALVELVHTGRYFGQDNFSPAGVRFSRIRVISRPHPVLEEMMQSSDWAHGLQTAMSIIALGRDNQERARYNAYGIVPLSLKQIQPGLQELTLQTTLVELDSGGLPPQDYFPDPYEISGVQVDYPAMGLEDGALTLTRSAGRLSVNKTSPAKANFWELRATSPGISTWPDELLRDMRRGKIDLRDMSRIYRNNKGQQTRRVDFYGSYLSRLRYPRFDRGRNEVVSQEPFFLSSFVQESGKGPLLRGLRMEAPVITDRFHVEISGITSEYEKVVKADFGAVTVDYRGGRPSLKVAPFVVTTPPGLTSLSAWHERRQKGNATPHEISLVYHNLRDQEVYRYNLFGAVPLDLSVTGSGDNQQETLSMSISAVTLDGNFANGDEMTTMNLQEAAGQRQFLLEMQGISDTSSWESINIQPVPGGHMVNLRGLQRTIPRGYIGQWLNALANGQTPRVDMTARFLDKAGAVQRSQSLQHCALSQFDLPAVDKAQRNSMFVTMQLRCVKPGTTAVPAQRTRLKEQPRMKKPPSKKPPPKKQPLKKRPTPT